MLVDLVCKLTTDVDESKLDIVFNFARVNLRIDLNLLISAVYVNENRGIVQLFLTITIFCFLWVKGKLSSMTRKSMGDGW